MVVALSPAAARPAGATGWDTEVFVLAGDDRDQLRERALALASFVENHGETRLVDLAATLAAGLGTGGARLAVVAASHSDLAAKLRRAAGRLADPRTRQIRETSGVYYSDEPLYAPGALALIFPGEGAQYTNMLKDLCGVFPEVEHIFAWSDQLAENTGKRPLRTILHPAPGNAAEAEAELRKLGPSIFGVLMADLALIRVLRNLELPVSAMAGHSAGELAALLASGAMGSEEALGAPLADTMDMMQEQEEAVGGPDVALLAVGGSKSAVVDAAGGASGVIVAMDNCPHQCVAVGPARAIAAVESALLARGLVCERLPFRRPYHTPLFEPWMGPFRQLFANIPFQAPHTPVYSCSTGEKFPADPDAVRDLAVNHWVSPVEFARMIERMHADGVRLFVEAGPRGNLSAFVEDVLRGRPFVAIPANVSRKSGPTQINHLVAQLAAHHVPFNLNHLYSGRDTQVVEWAAPGRVPVPAAANGFAATHPGEPDAVVVMNEYLTVMEQFLDVQREVMEGYLSGGVDPCVLPPELAAFADFTAIVEAPAHPVAPVLPEEPQPAEPPLALVGEIIEHEPQQSIVFRRIMDEREDLYADDHTLGGRGVSRINPAQNGLPVLPMTFSLEAMAEAASLLAPGKVVIGIRAVRLYRWLPFDARPTTLEVRAAVSAVDPESGTVQVKANVRDLGNSFLPDGANKLASEAVVVLADRYPDPPPLRPFVLTDERPCESAVEDLRRNMFHGPLFHMIRELGRVGKEGIDGRLVVQPRDRWFRSNPDPRNLIDPVLTDSAMHILGAWHLEQPDWSGRILLPIGVESMDYYGPPPAVGTWFHARGHNEEETARQVRHGLEVYDGEGRLWLRMTGASYWRFYLPFGDVNFFGPKDQYYLSRHCPEAEVSSRVPTRCHFLEPPADLQQPVLRASGVRVTMTPREIDQFTNWTGTDSARSEWFFRRLVAKDAARALYNEKHGGGIFPADIESDETEGGRLVCRMREKPDAPPLPTVAVALTAGKVAAFAAFAGNVGIALVPLKKNQSEDAARMAAARLAVADALNIPPAEFPVEPGTDTGLLLVAPDGRKLRVQTARERGAIIATTLCEVE